MLSFFVHAPHSSRDTGWRESAAGRYNLTAPHLLTHDPIYPPPRFGMRVALRLLPKPPELMAVDRAGTRSTGAETEKSLLGPAGKRRDWRFVIG